ncbi:hypothetical protein BGZ54_001719 [Gamsiella multidivaricata]|nr:hypothetical protein BGZ54_001719 [Gamsiella multidivaricata]
MGQNMMQLESVLPTHLESAPKGRKREFDGDIDNTRPLVSYGITTNAKEWHFVQCSLSLATDSNVTYPVFRTSTLPGYIRYEKDCWRDDVKEIFGHVVWLLERMVEQIPHRQKRAKTATLE